MLIKNKNAIFVRLQAFMLRRIRIQVAKSWIRIMLIRLPNTVNMWKTAMLLSHHTKLYEVVRTRARVGTATRKLGTCFSSQ